MAVPAGACSAEKFTSYALCARKINREVVACLNPSPKPHEISKNEQKAGPVKVRLSNFHKSWWDSELFDRDKLTAAVRLPEVIAQTDLDLMRCQIVDANPWIIVERRVNIFRASFAEIEIAVADVKDSTL